MMRREFTLLEETVRQACGAGPVYYLPNGGNWGDALIRYGTLKFLQDIGISHRELVFGKSMGWMLPLMRRGTLIYGGGGAWCELWHTAASVLKRVHLMFRHIVVLPSTYDRNYAISNATFFCRDSYESKRNMPTATFCHDMAFYIGPIAAEGGHGTGYFFRTDKESANTIAIPSCNNDISRRGKHWSPISPFIEEIAKYEVIHTDRLHVAIASCLLGKELHLYPGVYFKNRAVYLSSIAGHFQNTHFHDDGQLGRNMDMEVQ